MMKTKEKMNIKIEGNERNKSEVIYNNLLEKLDTKDAKIEYLKERLTYSEMDSKTKFLTIFIILIGACGLIISYLLCASDLIFLGALVGFLSFFLSIYELFQNFQRVVDFYKSDKFEKIDHYYDLLNKRLK